MFMTLLLLLSAAGSAQSDLPPALQALITERGALETGEVEWSISRGRIRRHYRSLFAPNGFLIEDRGDQDGVTRPYLDASQSDLRTQVLRELVIDGRQWEHHGSNLTADAYEGLATCALDVRTLGVVSAGVGGGVGIGQLVGSGADGLTYESRFVGDCVEVTSKSERENSEIRWLLDPTRGWNPISVRVSSEGRVQREAVCELEKFGESWFPRRVSWYDGPSDSGRDPTSVAEIRRAAFNAPSHKRKLAPEDIGITVGTNVTLYDGRSGESEVYGWDGTALAPLSEVHRRIRSGELQMDPQRKAEVNRRLARGKSVDSTLSRWEQYTLDFINRYQLDDDQRQRAMTILKDCTERGRAHYRKHEKEIEQIRADTDALFDKPAAASEERLAELDKLKKRMFEIEGPINHIEHRELRPRLDKLPTRAQRKATEGK